MHTSTSCKIFLFGGKAADAATSHLAASQRSSVVARRCLFTHLSSSVSTLPKYIGHCLLPFVLCHKDLSEGALLDEPVTEDGEPCGGRLRRFKAIHMIK